MKVLVFILITLVVLFTIGFSIYLIIQNGKLKRTFNIHNVAIYGAKGKGKDLLTQLVINLKKKPYLSNIDYGGHFIPIELKDLNINPNTYEEFINGEVIKIDKKQEWEGLDVYISDCGVFLPSTYDMLLNKTYKSLPIYYALSRHLYNSNINFNTQALNRVWIKLREQADYYVLCRGIIKLPFHILICITYYDNYESALRKQKPVRKGLFNKFRKSEKAIYDATYGDIHNSIVVIKKKHIHYDTRYFHRVVFGTPAPHKLKMKEKREIRRNKRKTKRLNRFIRRVNENERRKRK